MMTNSIKPEKLQVDDLFLRGFALFKSGSYQQAVDFFRMVTLMAPAEGRFWVSLGHALRKTGDLDGAVESLKAALLLGQQKDKDVWLTLAECYQDRGAQEKAQAALDEAIELSPGPEKERLEMMRKTYG